MHDTTSPCLSSMVIKGYKQPLVQEDMWELSEADSTAHINERFQHFMKTEFAAAKVRHQCRLKKKQDERRDKAQEDLKNGLSNGLGKGVSQDMLMMVKGYIIHDFKIIDPIQLARAHQCAPKVMFNQYFFFRRKREKKKMKRRRRKRTKRRRRRKTIPMRGSSPPFTRPSKGFCSNLPSSNFCRTCWHLSVLNSSSESSLK